MLERGKEPRGLLMVKVIQLLAVLGWQKIMSPLPSYLQRAVTSLKMWWVEIGL